MPKDVEARDGRTWFTTENAAHGRNQRIYIYGYDVIRLPPDTDEGWTSIKHALDHDGCPRAREPVTFNCSLGLVRSAIMAGLYMMRCLGMTVDQAMEELDGSVGKLWPSTAMRTKIVAYLAKYYAVCVAQPPAAAAAGLRRSGRH